MSKCISQHGEYSEHEPGENFACTLCGALDEDALVARVREAEAEVVKITANRDDWASRMMELASVTQRAERAESVIAEALDVARSASVPLGVPEAMHYDRLLAETRRVLSTYEKGATQ